jgi:hypothetical protein
VQFCLHCGFRDLNKVKRYQWSLDQLANEDQYDNVIWTDESKIMLESTKPYSFRKRGTLAKLYPKPKHPYSVSIFGGDLGSSCIMYMYILVYSRNGIKVHVPCVQ